MTVNLDDIIIGFTGFCDDQEFDERLEREFFRTALDKNPLSVLYVDIDGMGKVDNIYGRQTSNRIIYYVAQMISERIGGEGRQAAFNEGGDEFVIILPETTEERAILVGEALRQEFEATLFTAKPLRSDQKELNVNFNATLSAAVVTYTGDNLSYPYQLEYLASRAAKDKNRKRNQVYVYPPHEIEKYVRNVLYFKIFEWLEYLLRMKAIGLPSPK